jgi:hypothetical protein
VVLVEQAEQLPLVDVAVSVEMHWSIAINGQPQQAAMAESVARSAAWVALVDLGLALVAETRVTVLPEPTAERLAH